MPALKLALIRARYAADGGAERFVARTLDALHGTDVALTLISREWAPGAGGAEVITCDPFYLGRLWRDWSFARCVCHAVATHDFDLVQSHERIACCDLYRAGDGVHREWLAQRARVLTPLARLGTALNPYHGYLKRAERQLFESPRLKAVICNSKMVRDEILRYFRIVPEKLHVIYSGVDTGRFHPRLKAQRETVRARLGISADVPLYLFVGSGFERKGVAAAITALARGPADAQLVIVGRDKHAARFVAQAQRAGLAQRVRFLGPQAEVDPFYGAADALLLPTLYDPFPNVALEAMASGLPLVTSTKCGAAELIENGRNGFVVDALDTAGLAQALHALADRRRAEAMGQAARTTVEGLTLSAMADNLVRLYRALTAR
jgi:UDP-glucose:(heptosyl)LPS alpha-1,3-glucosyltransferase